MVKDGPVWHPPIPTEVSEEVDKTKLLVKCDAIDEYFLVYCWWFYHCACAGTAISWKPYFAN